MEGTAPAAVAAPVDTSISPAPAAASPQAQKAPESATHQAPDPQSKEPAPGGDKVPPKMFEVTIDGKKMSLTEQQLIAYASKGHVADKKFQEASEMKKSADKIKQRALKDPMGAIIDLGVSEDQLREAMESYYNRKYIEPETLTPEQRELTRFREEAKQREEEAKLAKEKEEQDSIEKMTTQHREVFQKQIISALEASGLPKTPFFAARMAFHMQENLRNGWEAPQELIVEQVKQEHNSIFKQIVDLPAEDAIKVLGDDFVNKIRMHDLQKLRESRGKLVKPTVVDPDAQFSNGGERRKLDTSDVNERLRRFKREGF